MKEGSLIKRRQLIELLIYVIVIIVGIFLLMNDNTAKPPTPIQPDFEYNYQTDISEGGG